MIIGEAYYECLQKAVDNRMIHEVSYTSWLICLNETSLDFQVQKLFLVLCIYYLVKVTSKGQLIWKGHFDVFKSTKKTTKSV